MKIFTQKNDLINSIYKEKKLGFVPTMGALHKGHIALIERSIKNNKKTIVSIFINKPQFNNNNDFRKYPKLINRDIALLKKLKVNYLFMPKNIDIYPNGINKKIKINNFSRQLCGKYRPNHFEAVIDVVQRFINIINPKHMYFGEKDMQQLILIKDFVKKNYPMLKIIGCKTIREKNGLPFSSRNFLLSTNDKKIGQKIYKFLKVNKNKILQKKILVSDIKKRITILGISKIDYIKILDINKIIKPIKTKKIYKIFISYYLKETRLIDNI